MMGPIRKKRRIGSISARYGRNGQGRADSASARSTVSGVHWFSPNMHRTRRAGEDTACEQPEYGSRFGGLLGQASRNRAQKYIWTVAEASWGLQFSCGLSFNNKIKFFVQKKRYSHRESGLRPSPPAELQEGQEQGKLIVVVCCLRHSETRFYLVMRICDWLFWSIHLFFRSFSC